MKTSKIKNLILIISIVFIVNIISIGTVNATQKAWDKTEAKTERIQISRYILANENQKIKSKYPNWTILTTNEISELDKNGDKKVDKNDLIKVKRHILAMENSTKKREHPDWIIYEEIVGESIELDKTTLTLENGKKGTLKATITSGSTTDNSITWSSTNTAVATVDSEGNVTAKKAGTATITAKTKSGKKASCKVTVEEPVAGIKLNKTTITMDNKRAIILGVTITPTNATNKTVTWSSSNTSIATVEKNGRVTAKKEGTATITVKSSNGKTATCKVTVEEPVTSIKMNKTTLALDNQKTETLKTTITPTNATNKTVTWSSSNEAVATVDKNGKVTAKKAGIATIKAKASNGKATSCKVTVTEPVTGVKLNNNQLTIENKKTETLKATITPNNATNKKLEWSSSNTSIATVDGNGRVTAKKAGTTIITVKTINGKTASCKVTVKELPTAVKLDKTTLKINKKKTITLKATITPADAINKTLTWSSSNSSVATVDKNGKVTAEKTGTAIITVKTSNGKTATCEVDVLSDVSSSTKPKSSSGDGYKQTITLNGKTFKLYKQNSGSYKNKHFNSLGNQHSWGTLSDMGCGPSSIAIVLSGYGYNYDPYEVGQLLMHNSIPSSVKSMEKEIKAIGMNAKLHEYNSDYQTTYKDMKEALQNGHEIVLYVGKKSEQKYWYNFTHSGYHFISILGIDSANDKAYVGNPGISGGWFDLSTIVKARGHGSNKTMNGWIEIYK